MCYIHSSAHSFQLLKFLIQLGIGKETEPKVSFELNGARSPRSSVTKRKPKIE